MWSLCWRIFWESFYLDSSNDCWWLCLCWNCFYIGRIVPNKFFPNSALHPNFVNVSGCWVDGCGCFPRIKKFFEISLCNSMLCARRCGNFVTLNKIALRTPLNLGIIKNHHLVGLNYDHQIFGTKKLSDGKKTILFSQLAKIQLWKRFSSRDRDYFYGQKISWKERIESMDPSKLILILIGINACKNQ
jgi:hypothetical protein